MSARVFNIGRRFTDFTQVSTGFSLGFDYPLYIEGLKRLRAGATYRLVDENLSDLRPTVENLFQDGVTSSTTLNVTYDSRNSVFLPTQGQLFQVTQEFAGNFMGGDNDFSKSELDARLFLPVGQKATWPIFKNSVLAFHLNTGFVAPLSDGSRVPLFERYFPGGVFTIRGFPLRSLGPRINVASTNDLGNFSTSEFVVGGNKQLIFNTEYIMPLLPAAQIYGVFFFDMGNAFDNGETLWTLAGQRQSAGFELRWYSPLSPAPFRFAWGYPLDRKDDENTVQFDFTFGTVF
jgi:outer membrane protein insertion porin family